VRKSVLIATLIAVVATAAVAVAVASSCSPPRHGSARSTVTPARQAVTAPSECFYLTYADGAVSPDPRCSPGAINPTAAAHPHTTLCNPASLTRLSKPAPKINNELLSRYGANPSAYVPAYVVPPQDGGSPTNPANEWPEPLNGWGSFHTRDPVVDRLHDQICTGKETVAAAAQLLERDWLSQGIPDDD
jgi:hypothetical protein